MAISSLSHKTNFNKFKGIEIIQSMFAEYIKIKLEIITDYMENSKHLESKPHTSKQSVDQRRKKEKEIY